MKLFYVQTVTFDRTRSLLPIREPSTEERELASMPPYEELEYLAWAYRRLIYLGYTPRESKLLIEALWNHVMYDLHYWARPKIFAAERVWWQVRDAIPAVRGATRSYQEFPGIPVIVIGAAIAAIVIVAYVLINPEEFPETFVVPPQGLRFGIYEERLWWMVLAGVSADQKPWYHAFGYNSPAIVIHESPSRGGVGEIDRLWFLGTFIFEGWRFPWFRRWRTLYSDVTFCGYLTDRGGDLYTLKPGGFDGGAPMGPWVASTEFIADAQKHPFDW